MCTHWECDQTGHQIVPLKWHLYAEARDVWLQGKQVLLMKDIIPTDRKIFAMGNLWPSALLKFTVARLFLKKDSLKSRKGWVFFLKNICSSRVMLLKSDLEKVCCQLYNLYRLFIYFSCAAICVVIHRRGKIMIFHQMAILLFFVTLPVRSLWSMASAAVQSD